MVAWYLNLLQIRFMISWTTRVAGCVSVSFLNSELEFDAAGRGQDRKSFEPNDAAGTGICPRRSDAAARPLSLSLRKLRDRRA
jgi:hypothetical protein